jgi:hypothetical protein
MLRLTLFTLVSAGIAFWAMSPSSKGRHSWQEEIRVYTYLISLVLTWFGLIGIAERIWGLRNVSEIMDVLVCLLVVKKAFDWREHLWEK